MLAATSSIVCSSTLSIDSRIASWASPSASLGSSDGVELLMFVTTSGSGAQAVKLNSSSLGESLARFFIMRGISSLIWANLTGFCISSCKLSANSISLFHGMLESLLLRLPWLFTSWRILAKRLASMTGFSCNIARISSTYHPADSYKSISSVILRSIL